MGIDYIPNNGKIEPLMLNFSGASMIGTIGYAYGFCHRSSTGKLRITDRIPYSADTAESVKFADMLKDLSDSEVEGLYNKFIGENLFEGTLDEFNMFLDQFETFFRECGGYTSL